MSACQGRELLFLTCTNGGSSLAATLLLAKARGVFRIGNGQLPNVQWRERAREHPEYRPE